MDSANLIEATDELIEYFSDYVQTTPEIREIKEERDDLWNKLRL